MKQLITGSVLIAILLAVFTISAQAQTSPMTEAHIERIRNNCVEAQSTLTKLHASDALLRVNRGQVYESIATKLMTPLNNRISLGKYDGSALASYTTAYEQQLNDFRVHYKSYEEAMTKTLRMNCKNQPVAFYDSVAEARAKRKQVYESTVLLQKTIQDYRVAFGVFKQKLLETEK